MSARIFAAGLLLGGLLGFLVGNLGGAGEPGPQPTAGSSGPAAPEAGDRDRPATPRDLDALEAENARLKEWLTRATQRPVPTAEESFEDWLDRPPGFDLVPEPYRAEPQRALARELADWYRTQEFDPEAELLGVDCDEPPCLFVSYESGVTLPGGGSTTSSELAAALNERFGARLGESLHTHGYSVDGEWVQVTWYLPPGYATDEPERYQMLKTRAGVRIDALFGEIQGQDAAESLREAARRRLDD